jgi:hypothetical protein
MQQQCLGILGQSPSSNEHPDALVRGDGLPPMKVDFENSSLSRLVIDTPDRTIARIPHGGNGRLDSFSKCARNKCYCSCHDSTSISGSFWSLKVPLRPTFLRSCNRLSCSNHKRASLWVSLEQIGIPYAVIASLDILWSAQKTFISPSLQIRRVVSWNAPAFVAVRDIR